MSKASELRAKDVAGLEKEVNDLLKAHFGLRMQKATQQLANHQTLGQTRRDIRAERDAFHRSYGNAVWVTGMTPVGVDAGSDAQYRFQKTFTDRCNALVRSSDAGGYFLAPESRLSGADLSRKTRAMIIAAYNGI